MRKSWISAGLVLLSILVAWLWVSVVSSPTSSSLSTTELGDEVTPRAGAAEEMLTRAEVPTADSDVGESASKDEGGAERRSRSLPTRGYPVVIRVVDDATGAPIPNARMAIMLKPFNWSSLSDRERYEIHRLGGDAFEMLAYSGYRVWTDARGELEVHVEHFLAAACETDGRFGDLNVRKPKPGAVLEMRLKPTRSLCVRVRGGDGRPVAEMPVVATLGFSEGESLDLHHNGGFAYTDANGEAVFKKVDAWVGYRWRGGKEPPRQVALRLGIIGSKVPPVFVSLPGLPTEPIEMTAPATGSFLIRLQDERGEPRGSHEDPRLEPLGMTDVWTGGARPAGPGAARFPFVALGERFEASADGYERLERPGPVRPGEEATAILGILVDGPYLTARLRTPAGGSVGRVAVIMDFDAPGRGGRWRMETDSGGRVRRPIPPEMKGLVLKKVFFQEQTFLGNEMRAAVLENSIRVGAEQTDLGDLVFKPMPVLVSGRIRASGAPVEDRPELLVVYETSSGAWLRDLTVFVEWQGKGRFKLRARGGSAGHKLHLGESTFLRAEPMAFERGAEVVLDMQRGGSVEARVAVEKPASLQAISLELSLAGSSQKPLRGKNDQWNKPLYRWDALPVGRYDLRVFGMGRTVLALVEGLEVRPGEVCRDPRLADLDLRGKLREVSVSVRDAVTGKPLRKGLVWSEGGAKPAAAMIFDGSARLWIHGPTDLRIAAEGHISGQRRQVTSDLRVALEPLPTTPVLVPAVEAPAGVRVMVRFVANQRAEDEGQVSVQGMDRRIIYSTRSGFGATELKSKKQVVELPYRAGDRFRVNVYLVLKGDVENVPEVDTEFGSTSPPRITIPAAALSSAAVRLRRRVGGL